MKTVIAGYALLSAAAFAAAYVSGYTPSEAVPLMVLIALFGIVMEFGKSLLLRTPRLLQTDVLRRAGWIFDHLDSSDPASIEGMTRYPLSRVAGRIAGREAEFSTWHPRDNPELPVWATLGEPADDDREPALALRIACASPVEFAVKNWGISCGPPFRNVNLAPEFTVGEPVDFTTSTVEAFTFWRGNEYCRELARQLIQNGVVQISVTSFDITVWWQLRSVSNWSAFGQRLPSDIAALLQFARALDGREDSEHRPRKCGRCRADLARADVYCSRCGSEWWSANPAEDKRSSGSRSDAR